MGSSRAGKTDDPTADVPLVTRARTVRHGLSGGWLGLLAGLALGQPAPEQQLPPVVVSAQKRERPAQDVPIGIGVLSGRQLELAGVDDAAQLDRLVIGLTVGTASPGELSLTLRGIADLDGGLLGTPATGFYLDETPLSAFTAQLPQLALWDAERVEVLRGPQGTLFGEGSMGGTVRVVTRKPDAGAFAARATATWSRLQGGGQGGHTRAMLNLPLQADTLALRAVAGRQALIGWIDVPELQAHDANDGRSDDLRLALRWTPSGRTTVDLVHARQRLDSRDPVSTSPGLYRPRDLDPDAQAPAFLSDRGSRSLLHSLTLQHDFDPATLVAAVSRYERRARLRTDLTPYVPLYFGAGVGGTAERRIDALTLDATTAELRLVSRGARVMDWTFGAYLKHEARAQQRAGLVIRLPEAGLPLDETLYTTPARVRAAALFGELELPLWQDWSLQAGLRRYASQNRTQVRFDTTSAIFPGFVEGVVRDSASAARALSPKLGLSWRPRPGWLAYATLSTGFRDGDSNYQPPGHPEVPAGYGPETVRAREIGLKAVVHERLSFEAALYRNAWNDLQLPFVTDDGQFGYLRNAGRASSHGLELEAVARPTAWLRVAVGVALADARIDEAGDGLAGRRVPFSPRRQAALSVARETAWVAGLQAVLSAQLSLRSATESEPRNDPRLRNPASRQLDLQAGVSGPVWSARLLLRNAGNAQGTRKRTAGAAGAVVVRHEQAPRSLGIELGARF